MKKLFAFLLVVFLLSSCSAVTVGEPTPTPTNGTGPSCPITGCELPTGTPFQPKDNTPTPEVVQSTATTEPIVINGALPNDLFISLVAITASFNSESSWLIAEPGVILDDTTAWTIGQVDAPYFVNVPEGAFTYFSLGEGDIKIDGVNIHLEGANGLNHLVLVRGKNDDGIVDSDLNMTAKVTNFVPGHAIWSHMPTGAYISKDWFMQQLVASSTGGFTNCGATGCSKVIVVLWDATTNFIQKFEVKAGAIDTWTLIP